MDNGEIVRPNSESGDNGAAEGDVAPKGAKEGTSEEGELVAMKGKP